MIKIMHQYLGENHCNKIRWKLTEQLNIAYLVWGLITWLDTGL